MKKPVNIVLFGPPGSGKGTQAAILVKKYGFNHISTGEIIRDEVRRETPLGKIAEGYISKGELLSDELVIGMIADYLERNHDATGNIFDGFPRTIRQAEELDGMLAGRGDSIDLMISLEVSDEEVVKRILLRGKESGRTDDLDEGVVRYRLDVYKKITAAVSEYYAAQDKYAAVEGTGSIEEISGRLFRHIDRLLPE